MKPLKGFIDEGEATRIALYLRSKLKKSKKDLFKLMSPLAKKTALEMEKFNKKKIKHP